MQQPQRFTSWLIACNSPEEAQTLARWLSSRIDLDRVLTDMVQTFDGGAGRVQSEPHRLGDYFADIRLLPGASVSPASFRLVFHRLPNAGRFWKDLMVNILQEIEATPHKPGITLDYKGDEEDKVPGAAPDRK